MRQLQLQPLTAHLSPLLHYASYVGGPPLDEDYWHMTAYYDNIRSKMKALNDTVGSCYSVGDKLPPRVCNTAMKVRRAHMFLKPKSKPVRLESLEYLHMICLFCLFLLSNRRQAFIHPERIPLKPASLNY